LILVVVPLTVRLPVIVTVPLASRVVNLPEEAVVAPTDALLIVPPLIVAVVIVSAEAVSPD
jgi:hypothetical protein